MQTSNLLILMSDEHCGRVMACSGHPLARTPHLDRLAEAGTRFANAYTNYPICVPARACFATGLYAHQTRRWDNCHPYDGSIRGWGHRLVDAGRRCVAIGKLHYRDTDDDNGFSREILPMHVVGGVGEITHSIRGLEAERSVSPKMAARVGPGETAYTDYDRTITDAACRWLREEGTGNDERPWTLYVGMVAPHFPLVAPPDFFGLYPPEEIPAPKLRPDTGFRRHPWIEAQARCSAFDKYFTEETRRIAIAAYLGLVSFLDDNIGRVLATLAETGLDRSTRVVYLSDHGDNLGARGLWAKSNHYEESAKIPMILAGPGIPAAKTSNTPVSLVDLYPTAMSCAGIAASEEERALPGRSLLRLASEKDDDERAIFAEYHANPAPSGAFMIRKGRFKLIHYVGMPSELFDLDADPEETLDLAADPFYAGVVEDCERELREVGDPDEIDRLARADQAAMVERLGGLETVLAEGAKHFMTPPPKS